MLTLIFHALNAIQLLMLFFVVAMYVVLRRKYSATLSHDTWQWFKGSVLFFAATLLMYGLQLGKPSEYDAIFLYGMLMFHPLALFGGLLAGVFAHGDWLRARGITEGNEDF